MLSDPQSVTISGTARTLPRLEERADTHVYTDRVNGIDLYVTQKVDKNDNLRTSVSLVSSEVYVDPITGLKSRLRPSVTVSAQQPFGVTAGAAESLYDALTTALGASTKALLKKILGGEK
jgi:hypothetical protein